MEKQANDQESKQEIIKQIKDGIETVNTQLDNFLEKSGAANVYNELLLLQQNTPRLDPISVLEELEAHPDVTFFKHLSRLKKRLEKWHHEESLELAEKIN